MLSAVAPATCERCGSPLPEGARFCPNCGAPVLLSDARERRVVTLVFTDLAGSTNLSAMLDPERYREVLQAFYSAVADELAATGGRIHNFVGDSVLGVFGIPHAHDDDAVRAVRAALALHERVRRLGEEMAVPSPLQVRVGLNSGAVAIGADPADRNVIAGAEVNLAARVQQSAEPGEVLVTATTRELTKDVVSFGAERRIAAKGFATEIVAWPVEGIARRPSPRTVPFVDRRRELALLTDTFERVVERGRSHLVTLLGEPGIGKSRVVEEFLLSLPEGTKVLSGRASAFQEDVTFAPIAEFLFRELGEDRGSPPEVLRTRLEDLVAATVHPSRFDQVVDQLALALGLEGEVRDDKRYQVAEVRAGLLAYLVGLAERGPVVLFLEDLHLARPVLLEMIERLVRDGRQIPLLVVCAARWDLLETKEDWVGGLADAVTLWVEPLSVVDSMELATAAGDGIDHATAEQIARHTGGNPFFIVETTGMVLRGDGGGPLGVKSGTVLPPTVQAALAARLDHLSREARELVRRASVFAAADFDVNELATLAEPRKELLEELEEEEVLERDPERSSVYRFRSDVLRDVAYETLAKRERQRLHLRVAKRLSQPDLADQYPRAIAYHLEQAARAALDLNPKDRQLADRAMDALVAAGDLARRGIESRAAAELYERALALAGPEHDWGEREGWVLSALGEAQYWLGEFDEAAAALSRALELAPDTVKVQAHASRFLADIELTIQGEPERAAALFDRALTAARRQGTPYPLARALLMAAWVPYWRGDLPRARALFQEALAVAQANPDNDPWGEARALVGLASVTSPVGDEAEALELEQRALAIGLASGDRFTTAVAREALGASLRRMWRLEEAIEHTDWAARTFKDIGARWERASALGDRGTIHRLSGRLEEAERDLRDAFRLCREIKERSLVTWIAAELARALLAMGRPADARKVLDDPAARLAAREPGSRTALLTAEALLALAEADPEGARMRVLEALEVERAQERGNPLAALVWWTARVFDPDLAGGEDEVAAAYGTLERAHWEQAIREPDLVAG